MKRPGHNDEALPLILLGVMFIAAVICIEIFSRPQRADGQERAQAAALVDQSAGSTPITLLTTLALAESDWRESDRAAQWFLLRRRATAAHISLEREIKRYASAFKAGLSDRSSWKFNVLPACAEPYGWQQSVEGPWSIYEKRCAKLFADARAFLDGTLADPCKSATQWGSRRLRRDVERAQKAVSAGKWVRVDCAKGTANAYYREVRR